MRGVLTWRIAGPEPLIRRGAAEERRDRDSKEDSTAAEDWLVRLRVEVDGAGGGDDAAAAGVEEEETPQIGACRGWTRGSVYGSPCSPGERS